MFNRFLNWVERRFGVLARRVVVACGVGAVGAVVIRAVVGVGVGVGDMVLGGLSGFVGAIGGCVLRYAIERPAELARLISKFRQALPHPRRIASILELLGKVLPPKDRETVWELPISDLVRDFKQSISDYRSTLARLWLYFRLVLQVALTLCEAIRVCILERIARLIHPISRLFRKD